ncbi:MAG: tetratricopeptide repeat protein [Steroidobacteraceae bacterium]
MTDAERIQVYREFRALFDARRYADALPAAERLVAMTEEQYGADDRALVNPLTNVGTTLYRLGKYEQAEQPYQRSVKIMEAKASTTDRQLLRPLHGLGLSYLAAGTYGPAATTLKHVVDLSRNIDGLFNVEQLPLIRPLIASYIGLDRLQEAEKEHQYALRVAETAYGHDDARLIGPLDFYARWFEYVGRYTTARAVHARALTIAERTSGPGSLATVEALRGIARSYRLEFLNGAEAGAESAQPSDPFAPGQQLAPPTANVERLNANGERALRAATEALRRANPPDHRRQGETLLELGDWYLIADAANKAYESYRLAWKELDAAGAVDLARDPRQLAYHAPVGAASRFRGSDIDEYDERYVELRFTVKRDGTTAGIVTASSTAPVTQEKNVQAAMRRARYAPRLVAGEAVDAPDVVWRERMLVKKPPEKK